jgi:hypothetical protein
MAKHRSHKRRTLMKSRTMRRGQQGGDLAGNPASSWGWGMGTVGNGWTQFMNALSLQPGQNMGTVQSNNLVPIGNINAQDSQGMIGTNLKGDIPQSGGKKRKSRGRRGGNLGAIIGQAAVPVALIAMNNSLGSRRRRRHR